MNIFWEYEDFVHVFVVITKIGPHLRVISMHLRVFS